MRVFRTHGWRKLQLLVASCRASGTVRWATHPSERAPAMQSKARPVRWIPLVAASVITAFAGSASALQPLDEFLRAARTANPGNREARAALAQRNAEMDIAKNRLYPSFNASGTYSRNQYE